MKKSLRDFLGDLDRAGELRIIEDAVDVRDVSSLISQSRRALMFNALKDYPGWRLCGGLLSTRKRLALAMGSTENEVAMRFEEGLGRALDPVMVADAPCQEVVRLGSEVDLAAIPYPMMHVLDGGPYISATMVTSKDPEFGRNVGSYRLMYRTPTETGIDLVSPSDMRFYYQRALERDSRSTLRSRSACTLTKCWLPRSRRQSIPTNTPLPADCTASRSLVKCKTVDLRSPADAEIVLEGEILPIGWTADEGPFGEFSQISGDVKWNPIFRVKCITHRKDPIFYLLQMPWENDWLCAPVTEAAGLLALRAASVKPVAIRAPVGKLWLLDPDCLYS